MRILNVFLNFFFIMPIFLILDVKSHNTLKGQGSLLGPRYV